VWRAVVGSDEVLAGGDASIAVGTFERLLLGDQHSRPEVSLRFQEFPSVACAGNRSQTRP